MNLPYFTLTYLERVKASPLTSVTSHILINRGRAAYDKDKFGAEPASSQ